MKWECYDARQETVEDRYRLAEMLREDWRITEVMANGNIYLRREVPEPQPKHEHARGPIDQCSMCQHVRAQTLREVGAWLRARWPAPDNPMNRGIWAPVFADHLAALERGEMPHGEGSLK